MGDFYIEDEVSFQYNTVEEAIADIKAGKLVIVVDDKGLENSGVLVADAAQIDAMKINFMMTTHLYPMLQLTASA